MVKRVTKGKTFTTPPVLLYRGDIEYLAELMGDWQVTLQVGRYEYEDVDELFAESARSRLSSLKISASMQKPHRHVSVTIEPDGTNTYANKNSLALGARIADFLNENSPWYSFMRRSAAWAAVMCAVSFLAFGMVFLLAETFFPNNVFVLLALLAVANGLLAVRLFRSVPVVGGTAILLERRTQHRGFFERNRDKIVLAIISALLSGLTGFFIGRIFD